MQKERDSGPHSGCSLGRLRWHTHDVPVPRGQYGRQPAAPSSRPLPPAPPLGGCTAVLLGDSPPISSRADSLQTVPVRHHTQSPHPSPGHPCAPSSAKHLSPREHLAQMLHLSPRGRGCVCSLLPLFFLPLMSDHVLGNRTLHKQKFILNLPKFPRGVCLLIGH